MNHGQCRINPPQLATDKYVGKWPEIPESSWCGQFMHRKTPLKQQARPTVVPRPESGLAGSAAKHEQQREIPSGKQIDRELAGK